MRWCKWGDKQVLQLRDYSRVRSIMLHALKLQRDGWATLANEGYLAGPVHEGFDRAITMAALLEPVVFGMKWVSSCTANLKRHGLPRGQAVTVLNDYETGLPLLVYDGTDISNARTAAFAMVAMERLIPEGEAPGKVVLVGGGRVHQWQARYLAQRYPGLEVVVCDPDLSVALRFQQFDLKLSVVEGAKWDQVCTGAGVLSVATSGTAGGWMDEGFERLLADRQLPHLWINTSLRDLSWRYLDRFRRFVVDDHVLAESQGTPYHEYRQIVAAVYAPVPLKLADLIDGDIPLGPFPVLVNPMGCAIWDIALGYAIWKEEFALEQETLYNLTRRG